jgi:hypothetical protein
MRLSSHVFSDGDIKANNDPYFKEVCVNVYNQAVTEAQKPHPLYVTVNGSPLDDWR